MMFGLKHLFEYFQCAGCGCLQLLNPPADMGQYYPNDEYYSFNVKVQPDAPLQKPSLIDRVSRPVFRLRDEAQVFEKGGLGGILSKYRPHFTISRYKKYVSLSPRKSFDMKILDVGCGSGFLLHDLAKLGFRNLEGIDPYGDEEAPATHSNVRIRKLTMDKILGESFDLIMFNHSLEHMPDQIESLVFARQLLTADGYCRIEIPVSDSTAYETYGTRWIELDAPRHYCLHTVRSMTLAASKAGLRVDKVVHVGTAFEFWGSELYRRELPLMDPTTKKLRDPATVFSAEELKVFEEQALTANASGRGGRAAFYLRAQ
jgi:SAM-dependent methyltransferase